MAVNFSLSGSTGKQVIISLRGLSHEVCVAVTQTFYWQQLVKDSSIAISTSGNYVPVELESICNDDDESRLHLIIQSQHERDNKPFEIICTRIHYDLIAFENNDRPLYNSDNQEVIVFGSLFNSLSATIFDTERHLLGQRNCNIKRIKNSLACTINVDQSIPQRYRFTIRHQQQTIMDLAAIQLQALVKLTQYQYVMAYALKIGRPLIGPIERMEIPENNASSSNPNSFPSFTPFQQNNKRIRWDNEDEEQMTNNTQPVIDSDQSDEEETIPDEKRYKTGGFESRSTLTTSPTLDDTDPVSSGLSPLQQRRGQIELLLNRICERMQHRTPIDHVARGREDSSQIKSYFRNTSALKTASNDSEISIELIEHEMDLRTRGMNEHKCTLVFNKQLKMGDGTRDRLKRTAKVRAYEKLKIMTRETAREAIILKPTVDGLWKAIIQPTDNE